MGRKRKEKKKKKEKMITIYTNYVNKSKKDFYDILLETYKKSIKSTMRNVDIIEENLDIPQIKNIKVPFVNHVQKEYFLSPFFRQKVKFQEKFINRVDNNNIILSDCDMLMLNSVRDVFKSDFDIAFTERDEEYLNTGIIFIKNSNSKVRKFFRQWVEKIDYLFENPEIIEQYKHLYTVAIDQCALGLLLEEYNHIECDLKIIYLPCSMYNSCQDTWEYMNDDTKIIHIKSNLRKQIQMIFNEEIEINDVEPDYLQSIIEKWFKYYND